MKFLCMSLGISKKYIEAFLFLAVDNRYIEHTENKVFWKMGICKKCCLKNY